MVTGPVPTSPGWPATGAAVSSTRSDRKVRAAGKSQMSTIANRYFFLIAPDIRYIMHVVRDITSISVT